MDPIKLRLILDPPSSLQTPNAKMNLLRRQLRDRGSLRGVGRELRFNAGGLYTDRTSSFFVSVRFDHRRVPATGKELVARTLHKMSPRRDKPFVAINCSAIPETLMESELFGHEKRRLSRERRLADKGVLNWLMRARYYWMKSEKCLRCFKAKLLRVIEERAVRRLGSRKEVEVDVRLLAATNRNPQESDSRR